MVNDEFGVRLIYPSSEGNEQYISFPKTLTELKNSDIVRNQILAEGTLAAANLGTDTIVWYEFEAESRKLDIGIYILPSSLTADDGEVTIDLDCDLDHEEAHERGYTNDSA